MAVPPSSFSYPTGLKLAPSYSYAHGESALVVQELQDGVLRDQHRHIDCVCGAAGMSEDRQTLHNFLNGSLRGSKQSI